MVAKSRAVQLLAVGIASAAGPAAILALPGIEREVKVTLCAILVAAIAFAAGRLASSISVPLAVGLVSAASTIVIAIGVGLGLGGRWWILAGLIALAVTLILSGVFALIGRAFSNPHKVA